MALIIMLAAKVVWCNEFINVATYQLFLDITIGLNKNFNNLPLKEKESLAILTRV